VDVVEYLWQMSSDGNGAGMMAAAMSTPAVRDALLRRAAMTDSWDELLGFAAAAAGVAEQEGWSRSGPETVAGICHWIVADRLLRQIPAHDRSARLSNAVLSSWSSPRQAAEAVAASPALAVEAGAAFTEALTADHRAGVVSEVLAELEDAMDPDPELRDPDLLAFACNTPPIRDALLRDAARSGRWADLAEVADEAAEVARAAGTFDAGPATVAAVARWMLGQDRGLRELESLRDVDPLAESVLVNGSDPLTAADAWAHAPHLDEHAARAFDDQANTPASLVVVPDVLASRDPLLATSDRLGYPVR